MTTEIGTICVSYLMDPIDADGNNVHGGNHYANADSIDDARAYAARVIGTTIGYCRCHARIAGVRIYGRPMEFYGPAWRETAGQRHHEVITA